MEKMLGNTLETWATYWEPIENLKGTHWEPGKNEKNPSPPAPAPPNFPPTKT
jgi:hypothetical protein